MIKKKQALRYNSGKLQWSLVDFDALEDMVKVLEFGAKKYAANNWKKGLNTNEIAESMMRHIFAYLRGENIDPESGLPHTGHIMCNAMFLSYFHKFAPKFDGRIPDENKINYTETTKEYETQKCTYYVPDKTTAMNCYNCGKPHFMHCC